MVKLSISIEGVAGLTWPVWRERVADVEGLGFAGLYISDHIAMHSPPAYPSPDALIALAYAAQHTVRVQLGTLVSPLSLRDPVQLARQAAALDDLSGGRMILGLGAGWHAVEHRTFGYELGDLRTRMDRFDDGVAVVAGLLRSDEPFTHEGRYFRVRDALLLPRPQRGGGPPVMIGGRGPKRTMPLAARYADIWNAQNLTPDELRAESARLDDLIRAAGRTPGDVRRTMTAAVICARDEREMDRRLGGYRSFFGDMPFDELLATIRARFRTAIIGTPEQVVARINAYGAVGIEEFMAQWTTVDDGEGLRLLAEEVLPNLA